MDIRIHPVMTDLTHHYITAAIVENCADREAQGQPMMPLESFYNESMFDEIAAAREWWPTDCPPLMGWVTMFGGALTMRSFPGNDRTLVEHLKSGAARPTMWLQAQGRSVERPNESKQERMRRLNRERVATCRAGKRAETADAAAAAWEHVVELQQEARRVREDYDVRVRELHAAMMAMTKERSEAVAEHKARVAEAMQAHRDAKENKT